jgi:hypothetical protein
MKKRLKDILKERKAKWLSINWTQHLMDIYNSRFNS